MNGDSRGAIEAPPNTEPPVSATPPSSSKSSQRLSRALSLRAAAGLLAAATFLLYLPTARFAFIRFDDTRYLTENPVTQQGLSWSGVIWAFTTFEASNWHPLTWISHMIDVQLFGMSPGAHHLVNAAVHAANAGLLLWVLARMTGAPGRSAFVAALFAVHPLRVESVAWIAERKDVLSTLLGLIALSAYVRHAARPRARSLALVGAFFALSLLAKPMWVTFPFLLLLLDYWPLRRIAGLGPEDRADAGMFPPVSRARAVGEKLPLLGLTIVSSALTVVAQRGALVGVEALPLPERLGNAAAAYLQYVAKTFWPSSLAVFYPLADVGFVVGIASAIAVLGVTGALVARAARFPWAAVGWCWFLGTLVPVIGVVQVGGQAYADRYTYLPSIGLLIAVVWSIHRVGRLRWNDKRIAAAGAAVTVLLSACTARQLSFWHDQETLFRRAIAVTEGNAIAHDALATELRAQGRLPEAVAHAREAVRFGSGFAPFWYNLGVTLGAARRDQEAIPAYEQALALDPTLFGAWTNLASLYYRSGRSADAGVAFEAATRADPEDPMGWRNLGVFLARSGRSAEAAAAFREERRIDPSSHDVLRRLALALHDAGAVDEALGVARELEQVDPASAAELRSRLGGR